MHAGEKLHDYETRLVCKDGTIKHVLIDANVLWEQGQFIHTRCFTRDITAQKQTDETRERLAALVGSSDDAIIGQTLGTLLASVAHELNNPLAIIMMQTDLLHEERHDDVQAEPMKAITQAAERCMRIVRNFLTLARQHPPERQTVALNTVVQGAMELLVYGLQVDTIGEIDLGAVACLDENGRH